MIRTRREQLSVTLEKEEVAGLMEALESYLRTHRHNLDVFDNNDSMDNYRSELSYMTVLGDFYRRSRASSSGLDPEGEARHPTRTLTKETS